MRFGLKAAISGEKRCAMTQTTAAKETRKLLNPEPLVLTVEIFLQTTLILLTNIYVKFKMSPLRDDKILDLSGPVIIL